MNNGGSNADATSRCLASKPLIPLEKGLNNHTDATFCCYKNAHGIKPWAYAYKKKNALKYAERFLYELSDNSYL